MVQKIKRKTKAILVIVAIVSMILIYMSFFSTGPCMQKGIESPTIQCFVGYFLMFLYLWLTLVMVIVVVYYVLRNKKRRGISHENS